jgi:hypothetical protein
VDMTVMDKIGNNILYFILEAIKKEIKENYMVLLLLAKKKHTNPAKGV